jgi:hypothetical protein
MGLLHRPLALLEFQAKSEFQAGYEAAERLFE